MDSCVFCKIINREIPVEPVYEDELVLAFNDINPEAPIHVLLIPKVHVKSALEIDKLPKDTMCRIMEATAEIARKLEIDETGFRIVCNCGDDGGQTVEHLHYHLLGKRKFNWPPG